MMILGREAELKESVIDTSCSNSRVSCFPDYRKGNGMKHGEPSQLSIGME